MPTDLPTPHVLAVPGSDLVPPNRTDEFVAAIAQLAEHPDDRLRFGRSARRRITQSFDSSKNVRVLANLLTGVSPAATDHQVRLSVSNA